MQKTPDAPLPQMPPLIPAPPSAAMRTSSTGRLAFGAKLTCIGGLALLMLLPLNMIGTRLQERLGRRNEAINNISATWGNAQTVVGPILVVPYRKAVKIRREQVLEGRRTPIEETEFITVRGYFLPSELNIRGSLAPSQLHRGIYTATVYRGGISLSGTFTPPDFKALKIDPALVQWEDAVIVLAITDLRGVRDALTLNWNSKPLALLPGARMLGFASTVQAKLPGEPFPSTNAALPFAMALDLNGSDNILFAPLGAHTSMSLDSTWPDPSFQGAFLPATRHVNQTGFKADWQMSYYGRAYPQSWTDDDTNAAVDINLSISACGVSLVTPVDSYRLVERSIKYGVLFVALLFTGFFLFETLAGLRIHPLQYLLVGAALCLFYLTLLSLAELVPFGWAYLIGAGASSGLTVCYSLAVLGKPHRAAVIGIELAAIYTFLYITLQLQDYALLFGTAGLFITLAIVMYTTRKVNWYMQGGNSQGAI